MRVALLGCVVLALGCSSPASKPAPATPAAPPPQPAEPANTVSAPPAEPTEAAPAPPRSANDQLDEFADRSCACKDAACGQQVMQDFLAWAQANKDAQGDERRAEASMKRMQDCIRVLARPAGGGST